MFANYITAFVDLSVKYWRVFSENTNCQVMICEFSYAYSREF